ncbi:MAG TPA: PBP1A family penicillin-binding protein [Candidatus Kapabacteria bacterium]|nr:PBP1A family penicillin-binding protein [Candidatus Kapabacteria bacterium]
MADEQKNRIEKQLEDRMITPTHISRFTRKQLQAFSFLFLIFSIFVVWLSFFTVDGLPSIEQLEDPKPDLATRVYSVDGELLDQYYIKNRTAIPYDSLPKPLINALIATEDRDFYSHWGISLTGIMRAVLVDVFTLSKRQGASTITQQLARNLYLTQERTWIRKIREAVTAVQIERTFTKEEILQLYFNVTYFGRGAYGVQAASLVYFGKSASQLTLPECAFMIGLLKAPERYDPDTKYERALLRRNTVLDNMYNAGFITEDVLQKAKATMIVTHSAEEAYSTGIAPHFIEWVRQQLTQLMKRPAFKGYDLYRDGLVVYTTLDSRMQRCADKAVVDHLKEFQPQFDKRWKWNTHDHAELAQLLIEQAIKSNPKYIHCATDNERTHVFNTFKKNKSYCDSVLRSASTIQVGFCAIDPHTGEIRAMVGGSNFREFRYGLNHVTQIQRQPGSSFKPFAYASAILHGYTPDYMMPMAPYTYKMPDGQVWTPSNTPEEEAKLGDSVTLRTALQLSINSIAARVITQLTSPHDVAHLAHMMGIHSMIPEYPSIALGTAEVTPLEITGAYAAFANRGIAVQPFGILRVEDKTGKVLYRAKPALSNAIDAKTAYTMTQMMQSVVDGGTGSSVRQFFTLPCAGKTGTTQDFADAWFVGYTPELCAGTWVGFDDRRITFGGWYGQGGKAAAPLWGRFMQCVYANKNIKMQTAYFTPPEFK